MRRVLLPLTLMSIMIGCAKEEAASTTDVAVPRVTSTVATSKVVSSTAPISPKIIRTADLQLSVKDVARSNDVVTSLIDTRGGYVATSRNWSESGRSFASLVARVPEARLGELLRALHGIDATVESESVRGDDVSQEFVDLAARLKNLEATEVELRALLTSVRVRSQKAAEVLEVHRELVSIRGEIEEARGRLQYLQQMTAFATVNISLAQHGLEKPLQEAWTPMVTVRNATRALLATGEVMATVAIWLGIYVLPLSLAFLLAGWGLRWGFQRGRRGLLPRSLESS